VFSDCSSKSESGGAIYLNRGSIASDYGVIFVDQCSFLSGRASSFGGAIFISDRVSSSEKITISNTEFINVKVGTAGAAIAILHSLQVIEEELLIQNITFDSCISEGLGGALYMSSHVSMDSTFSFLFSRVRNCRAFNTAGIIYGLTRSGLATSQTIKIDSCEFSNLTSSAGGSAFSFVSENESKHYLIAISRSEFAKCTSLNDAGGAVSIVFGGHTSDHSVIFSWLRFIDSRAFGGGGSVAVQQFQGSIRETYIYFINCSFTKSGSDDVGGAVLLSYENDATFTYTSFVDCQFDDCVALRRGGAVHMFSQASFINSRLMMLNSSFNQCTAPLGSVIHASDSVESLNWYIIIDQIVLPGNQDIQSDPSYIVLSSATSSVGNRLQFKSDLVPSSIVVHSGFGVLCGSTINSTVCFGLIRDYV
jgi:hypothetical protein